MKTTPQKVQTSFGIIEIAQIDEATDFVSKYQITGSNPFTVTGGKEAYEVDLLRQTCTCPDAFYRHRACKHVRNLNFLLTQGFL